MNETYRGTLKIAEPFERKGQLAPSGKAVVQLIRESLAEMGGEETLEQRSFNRNRFAILINRLHSLFRFGVNQQKPTFSPAVGFIVFVLRLGLS